MTAWPKDELRTIAEADDLHISPFREDGEAYGTPTWIWSVVVDDALYVRAYNGRNSRCFGHLTFIDKLLAFSQGYVYPAVLIYFIITKPLRQKPYWFIYCHYSQ